MIVGSLLFYFISSWNVEKTYDDVNNLINPNVDISNLQKVDFIHFAKAVYQVWNDCDFGYQNKTLAIYVDDSKLANLNKTYLFDYYKKFNFCNSIQSLNNSCGTNEDINFTSITLPAIVHINCSDGKLFIT